MDDRLEEIYQTWILGRQQHRDAIIRVGRLIREYILARLKEGDGLNEEQRILKGATRFRTIIDVAKRLGTTSNRINDFIRIAAFADLIRPLELGSLSVDSLKYLVTTIKRKGFGSRIKGLQAQRGLVKKEGEIDYIEKETWVFKEGVEKVARAIVSKAVQENWSGKQVRAAVHDFVEARGMNRNKRREVTKLEERDFTRQIQTVARTASLQDIASMVSEIVGCTADPQTVLRMVQDELRTRKVEKPRLTWSGV